MIKPLRHSPAVGRAAVWRLLVIPMICSGVLVLTDSSAYSETQAAIKASYIFNFAKFVTWPKQPEGSNSFRICVYGGDQYYLDTLEQVVARKKIGLRWVEIKPTSDGKLRSCQIVFFPASEKPRTAAAIDALAHAGVLLIGEDQDFLKSGGMINLSLENGRVVFEINRTTADQANIRLNSQLLALARNIYVDGHLSYGR